MVSKIGIIYSLFRALRPEQWVKNGFVLIPMVFARKLFDFPVLLKGLSALGLFCLMTGALYLVNDLKDLQVDREHPMKRKRPLASGRISPATAKWTVLFLLGVTIFLGGFLGRSFVFVLLGYVAVQLIYNFRLREIVILDIFCVSSGFFLRVLGGGVAEDIVISNWLIICTLSIAMFLTLGKRRSELSLLGTKAAVRHRRVFEHYTPYLLDQMIAIVTAITMLSYMLYCISPQTIAKFHTERLIYTYPFVMYGIFRYLYLIHRGRGGEAPERLLLSDLPLFLSVLLWAVCCVLIIYGGI